MREVYSTDNQDGEGEIAPRAENPSPSLVDSQTWQRVLQEMKSGGREKDAFRHLLTPPRDWMFLDKLAELSQRCDNRQPSHPPTEPAEWKNDIYTWNVYIKMVRMRLGQVRERYNAAIDGTSGGKGKVTSLEEVGFGVKEVMGSEAGDGDSSV